ncbi:MAG TPA: PKD domain-containing protein, partial [bacterium]|nr:PKD domain-containing protein [bacterium]
MHLFRSKLFLVMAVLPVWLLFLGADCGDDSDPTVPGPTMTVSPGQWFPEVGDEQTFTANPSFTVTSFTWATNNPAVVSLVSASGSSATFRAVAPGSADVIARSNGPRIVEAHASVEARAAGAPLVTAVTPAGGQVGESVTFSATATGSPTSWSWNFGGAGIPNSSTAANPTVTLSSSPGTFTGRVTATNALGSSPPFTFTITVASANAPSVTAVSPLSGTSGSTVTFTATTTGSPTEFQWFFGGGAGIEGSTDEAPTVILGPPGTYTGSVRVGRGDDVSVPFSFTYTVTQAPGTFTDEAAADLLNSTDPSAPISAVVFDGRPAVVFDHETSASSWDIRLARATTAMPDGEADWDVHTIANSTALDDRNPQLTVYQGRLAVLWGSAFGSTRLALANTGEPTAASDWTIADGPSVDMPNGHGAFNVLDGRLALLYKDSAGIAITVADVEDPDSPSDWTSHQIGIGALDEPGQLIVRPSGLPAVVWLGTDGTSEWPNVALGEIARPGSNTDWHVVPLGPFRPQGTDFSTSIVAIGDFLGLTWNNGNGADSYEQRFAISSDPDPRDAADWTQHVIDASAGGPATVALFGGRPVVAYTGEDSNGDSHLRIAVASDATPSVTGDWAIRERGVFEHNSQPVVLNTGALLGVAYADIVD